VESSSVLTASEFSAWARCGRESAAGSRRCGWHGGSATGAAAAFKPVGGCAMVGLSWAAHDDGSTRRLGRFECEARLGQLGWAARKIEKNGEGKEEAGWAGLRFQLGFVPLPNRN
jgi:hypothetical protein